MSRNITTIVQTSSTDCREGAFRSVESALRFAFGNSDRGLPDSLGKWQPARGRSDALFDSREERAAWAGDIKRRIGLLGQNKSAVLIVKFAPRAAPCSCRRPCCSGWSKNPAWQGALEHLAERSSHVLSARGDNSELRMGAVKRWALGEAGDFTGLACKAGVSRQTAAKHSKEIRSWLDATLSRAIEDARALLSEP